MHRLYSTFPSGSPGIALLLLRGTIGVQLLMWVSAFALGPHSVGSRAAILCAVALVASAAFVLGLLTPVAGVLSAMAGIATYYWHPMLDDFAPANQLTPEFIVMATAVALLGPGAFSLDARFFGRRKIIIPRETNS